MLNPLFALLLTIFAGLLGAADQIAFVQGNHYEHEGQRLVAVTVVRSGTLAGEASVRVEVDALASPSSYLPAVPGIDYDFAGATVVFVPGQRLANVDIPIRDDAQADGDRILCLKLESPVNAGIGASGISGLATTCAVVVLDDESSLLSGPSVLINPGSQGRTYYHETVGTIRVPVARIGRVNDPLTASWTIADGSGAITPLAGTVMWGPGDAGTRYVEAALSVTSGDGDNRDCLLTVSTGAATVSHTITIVDAVGRPGGDIVVPFAMPLTVVEPATTAATVRCWIERQRAASGPVSLTVALADAAAAADVTLLTTSVAWADGESGRKYIDILVQPDGLAEENESIWLNFSLDALLGTHEGVRLVNRSHSYGYTAVRSGSRGS
jgi:hypothetical protein